MKKFEHKALYIKVDAGNLITNLNDLVNGGWEIISFTPIDSFNVFQLFVDTAETSGFVALLKREIANWEFSTNNKIQYLKYGQASHYISCNI